MRALALLLFATTALAAGKPKVVVDAPGPMKALLTNALKKKFTPVPAKKPMSDAPLTNEVRQVVREAGAVAVITARLSSGNWSVMVLNGADGTVLEQLNISAGKKPLKALPKGVDLKLGRAISEAKPPRKEEPKKEEPKPEPVKEEAPPPEPAKEEPVAKEEEPAKEEPKAQPPPPKLSKKEQAKRDKELAKQAEAKKEEERVTAKEEEAAPSEDSDQPKPMALSAAVGGRVFSRSFYYKDDLFGSMSKYALPAGPALALDVDWFPGAHVTRGPLANFGLSLKLTYAVAISSLATDGTRYSTSAMRVLFGVLYRIIAGPVELRPTVGVAVQTYAIANGAASGSKPNIPDVSYTALRAGLDARVHLAGPLFITTGFFYDAPFSAGEIGSASYFPHLKVGGLDANLGIALAFGSVVELRAAFDYIHYWYSLNPDPADAGVALSRVAGGATDDYRGGTFTLAFKL